MEAIAAKIFEYFVQQGGINGALVFFFIIWIAYKEGFTLNSLKVTSDKKDKEDKESVEEMTKEIKIISMDIKSKIDAIEITAKSISSDQTKLVNEYNLLSKAVTEYFDKSMQYEKRIKELTEKIDEINDARVDELKEVLRDYNDSVQEITLAMEKLKIIISIDN